MEKFIRVKADSRFRVGMTTFTIDAGTVVRVTAYDHIRHKYLVDFGDRLVDWFSVDYIDGLFEEVNEP